MKFDVQNNDSPAESTPPTAQSVSVSSSRRKSRAKKIARFELTRGHISCENIRDYYYNDPHTVRLSLTVVILSFYSKHGREERGETERE